GGYQLRGNELIRIDLFEQAAHQRRLPRPDFPGNDDEAFTLVDAVLQVREGTLVSPTPVEKSGIRIELERLASKPEKSFVHRCNPESVGDAGRQTQRRRTPAPAAG